MAVLTMSEYRKKYKDRPAAYDNTKNTNYTVKMPVSNENKVATTNKSYYDVKKNAKKVSTVDTNEEVKETKPFSSDSILAIKKSPTKNKNILNLGFK